jgi:hypothetical protein
VRDLFPIDPYTRRPHGFVAPSTNGKLHTNSANDEGAAAMSAHSLLSPEQRRALDHARDRAQRHSAQHRRSLTVQRGDDETALGMEPPSLAVAIAARRRSK